MVFEFSDTSYQSNTTQRSQKYELLRDSVNDQLANTDSPTKFRDVFERLELRAFKDLKESGNWRTKREPLAT